MKHLFLVMMVGVLVGCGKKPTEQSVSDQERPDVIKPSKPPVKTEAQIEAESKAFDEIKARAEAGDAESQSNLGAMYLQGTGVEKNHKEAVKWWLKAAEQGNAQAQYNLGFTYYKGTEVQQDYEEAVKWWRKAAEQGFVSAQHNLGVMYEKGQGVLGDYREAVKWYRKAAEKGDASAQNNLGVMYADGAGVLQDYVTAYAWANVAEANGNDVKKFKSEFLEMKMTPDQIAKAEELTKEMIKKNPKLINE